MADSIQALLIDLDGVIYQNRELIPGVHEALKTLTDAGIPYRFITNATRKSKTTLINDLSAYGLDLDLSQVFAAPHAAVRYCSQAGFNRLALFTADREIEEDFTAFQLTNDQPDAVVVGDLGTDFSYEKLNDIFQCMLEGAVLVAMHKNRYWHHDHRLKLDMGPFIAALEYAANTQAVVVGKPSADFFKLAASRWDFKPDQIAMVGDDLDADIGGANAAGMISIQVKTGKYVREVSQSHAEKPDYLVDSFADVPGLLGLKAGH